jgi:UDP-glucose 4-epimerase
LRDYIHVCDLASGHEAALDYLNNSRGITMINLGTGIRHSVMEMLRAFEIAWGCVIPHKVLPRRMGDIAECWANPLLALKELNWKTRRDLSEVCKSTIKFIKLQE